MFSLKRTTAYLRLKELEQMGVIQAVGRGKETKYVKKVTEELKENSLDSAYDNEEKFNECVKRIANQRMMDELRNGVQTIQYQINTLMTTNG